jgi:hypothetical protein
MTRESDLHLIGEATGTIGSRHESPKLAKTSKNTWAQSPKIQYKLDSSNRVQAHTQTLYGEADSPIAGGDSPRIRREPVIHKVTERNHNISPESSKLVTTVNNFSTTDYLLNQDITNQEQKLRTLYKNRE